MSAQIAQIAPVVAAAPVVVPTVAPTVAGTISTQAQVKDDVPKIKKPYLSAKYQKFLVFQFWSLHRLHANLLLDDTQLQHALQSLHTFHDIPTQSAFFQDFLDDFKPTLKTLKTKLKTETKNNTPKPTRTKKAVVDAEDSAEKPKKKRVTKPKVPANVETDPAAALIQELVTQANATDEEVLASKPSEESVPVQKPKAVRKPRTPKVKQDTTAQDSDTGNDN